MFRLSSGSTFKLSKKKGQTRLYFAEELECCCLTLKEVFYLGFKEENCYNLSSKAYVFPLEKYCNALDNIISGFVIEDMRRQKV